MWHCSGKGVIETSSESYEELGHGQRSGTPSERTGAVRTAISKLSASTGSWGGDGLRFLFLGTASTVTRGESVFLMGTNCSLPFTDFNWTLDSVSDAGGVDSGEESVVAIAKRPKRAGLSKFNG